VYHAHEAAMLPADAGLGERAKAFDLDLAVAAVAALAVALIVLPAAAPGLAVGAPFDLGPLLVVGAAAATLPRARLGVGRGESTVVFDATGAVLLAAALLLRPEWFPLVALAASLRGPVVRVVLNTCVRTIALASSALIFHAALDDLARTALAPSTARVVGLVAAGVTLIVVEALLFRHHLRGDDGSDRIGGVTRIAFYRDAPAVAVGCVAIVLLTTTPTALVLLVPVVGLVVRSLRDQERLLLSAYDHKTGLLTSVGFRPQAAGELARARRYGRPLVLLMMDLDGLKSVNTVLGFLAGESVIRTMGRVLREEMRAEDVVARLGGDEFGLLLPDTDLEGGLAFAERVRAAIAATPLTDGSPPVHRTASIGLAVLTAHDDLASLMNRADHGLRQAKAGGRDRVVAMGPRPAGGSVPGEGQAC
jgi:diguanylate cyclase (GGDEF)-like protein